VRPGSRSSCLPCSFYRCFSLRDLAPVVPRLNEQFRKQSRAVPFLRELYLGAAWNGTECVHLSGCSCEGEDCDSLYGDIGECQAAHADCLTCDPAPGDPGVEFYGNSVEECAVILFACEEGTEYFANDCGCGCKPTDGATCEAVFGLPAVDCSFYRLSDAVRAFSKSATHPAGAESPG